MKSVLIMLVLLTAHAVAQDVHVRVSAAEVPDGVDKFATISMALGHAPEPGPGGRLYIHIAPGTYRERLYVSRLRPRTTFLGEGNPGSVVITAGQNVKSAQSTFFTETVEILGDEFQADNITFENAAGPTGQAVAISVTADKAIFKHCRFIGDQDTLFADYGRQYYVDTYISGGVDFIFGNATACFDNSEIHIIRPGYLTAQSRTNPFQTTGYVIRNSRVTTEKLEGGKFYLGRPWREYSRVVFLHTEFPANVRPEGWDNWGRKQPGHAFYAEYQCTGAGADTQLRVPWSHQLTAKEAAEFVPAKFLAGADGWNPEAEAAHMP